MGQAMSSILNSHLENPRETVISVATITTLQAGLFSFLLGIFRLGFIDVVLSRALMRGFMIAIALVIMM